ncbi:hypothetical protein [Lebetimonas sp. JH292]|uniref:hypothetical protein n=1 Tax=Lebetimonas sp. JH292 TaxID=990068 RepID=UPI00191C416D|nr:hypothetical protein [Lebetimonas sp. JH292]
MYVWFRFCDTVGILTPLKTYEIIKKLTSLNLLPIEMHTHNASFEQVLMNRT